MKRLLNLFLGFAFLAIPFLNIYSQKNYVQGYIILENGKTIDGYIDYRVWDRSPAFISFSREVDAEVNRYYPIDLKEFGVEGVKYISAIVEAENSLINNAMLDGDAALSFRTDTAFLEVLFSGKKKLYHYKDWEKKDHFYIETEKGLELLGYKKYMVTVDYQQVIRENKKYQGQLNYYLSDYSDIDKSISNASYNIAGMKRVFGEYYKGLSLEPEFRKKGEKVKIQYGLLGGASYTSFSFLPGQSVIIFIDGGYIRDTQWDYLFESSFEPSLSPVGGAFIEFVMPETNGRLSIFNDLQYASFKFSGGLFEDPPESNFYTLENYYIDFGATYLQLTNLLRIKTSVYIFDINLHGGVFNGLLLSGYDEELYEHIRYSTFSGTTRSTEEGTSLEKLRKLESGIVLGVGFSYKNFFMDFRGSIGNGTSTEDPIKTRTLRLISLAGYRF